jgi:hypothetical protein
MEQIGEEIINSNTEARIKEKHEHAERMRVKMEEDKKNKELEKLFNAKLQAFEIDEIRNSQNRALKTRLRRAKTVLEVNIYAMMIVMETMENESED